MATETSVPTSHRRLLHWVDEAIERFEPDDVHWCDGTAEEYALEYRPDIVLYVFRSIRTIE